MVRPIELNKSSVAKAPYLVWNAFIELIASNTEDLNDIQRVAHFAFRYDAEVQNGGHYQYFENIHINYQDKEEIYISAALEALNIIKAEKQAEILSKASTQYSFVRRQHPSTVEEFSEFALEDEFGKFDDLYYECSPDINNYLEDYLQSHMEDFVILV